VNGKDPARIDADVRKISAPYCPNCDIARVASDLTRQFPKGQGKISHNFDEATLLTGKKNTRPDYGAAGEDRQKPEVVCRRQIRFELLQSKVTDNAD